MKELVKVWPLRAGITGCNPSGSFVALTPGLAGWMTREQLSEVSDNDVQIMAGLRPRDLKEPNMEPMRRDAIAEDESHKPRRRSYKRRDIRAEDN